MIARLKLWAKKLKSNLLALYLAYKSGKISWLAKVIVIIVVSYALSPIDLIPDFIPIIGFLDDIILLPLGIMLAIKLIPQKYWLFYQKKAKKLENKKLVSSKIAALCVVFIWVLLFLIIIYCY